MDVRPGVWAGSVAEITELNLLGEFVHPSVQTAIGSSCSAAFQRVNQEVGKNLSVLWSHIDSTMNRTLLLPEFQQKLGCIMPNLKEIGISGFRLSTGSSHWGAIVLAPSRILSAVPIDTGLGPCETYMRPRCAMILFLRLSISRGPSNHE
jgi:hypothetical protein